MSEDKAHKEQAQIVQQLNKAAAELWLAKAEECKLKTQIAELNAKLAELGAHHAVVVGW